MISMRAGLPIETVCQEEWPEKEAARLALYRFLHTIYSYPTLDTLHFLKDSGFSSKHGDAVAHLGLDAQNTFVRILDSLDREAPELLEDLEVEYTRLFINSFNGVPAKPYESVYIDKGHLVIGKATLRVRELYNHFGVGLSSENPEPPDHIAIETEFIAYLIAKEIEAYREGETGRGDWFRDGQIRFLQQHLLVWARHFSDLICLHAQHPFYHEAGSFSKIFFDFERKLVGF